MKTRKKVKNSVDRTCHIIVKLSRRFRCWIGIHDWYSETDHIQGDSGYPITFVWKECNHCVRSKLIGVYSNE